jgi:hypothetical protein
LANSPLARGYSLGGGVSPIDMDQALLIRPIGPATTELTGRDLILNTVTTIGMMIHGIELHVAVMPSG